MAAPATPRARSSASPPSARLASSQLRRMRRIVDAAVSLAEQGGFEGVRLRDVADRSDVALGTLYRYFRSKEDLLLFALYEEISRLEEAVVRRPPAGARALERVDQLFRRATRGYTQKPQFARAVLRAMTAGDPDTAVKIAGVQLRVSRLVVAALRGQRPDLEAPLDDSAGNEREQAMAFALQNVWFASLVGWGVGLHDPDVVSQHVRDAAALMLGEPL